MPASEKTWRDQKTLHVVFGCTGLLMLVATVWMFAADHSRQWKGFQRTMREVDVRLTQWRLRATETQANATQQSEYEKDLKAELASVPNPAVLDGFLARLDDVAKGEELRETYAQLADPAADEETRRRLRSKLQSEMERLLRRARFEEDNLLSKRKFKAADYDEMRAVYDLGIRDSKPREVMDELQQAVDQARTARDELTREYQAAADYRKRLESAYRELTARTDDIQKQLADLKTDYTRLSTALEDRQATYFTSTPPFLGKRLLELPILDAFNSPLKVDNLWTQNLTIPNGSFGSVRRFDRCTTCHRAIDRTAPGSAVDPLYETAHVVELELMTPDEEPTVEDSNAGDSAAQPSLFSVYGIDLAGEGLIDPNDVTIRQVLPESLAALARASSGDHRDGLMVGDVIAYVRNDKVLSVGEATRYLLRDVEWGKPVKVTVVRGLPQPYSSHPRLDLFVGSLSPHTVAKFGCSVCHEGQGSATDFRWTSHTPNTPEQQDEWVRKYGWFNNHHWIYPMTPARFSESTCLKCHHNVSELELATQFDEPPAPKLVAGYHLIRQYGCYGCHEINGYKTADERIGPDMRLEPNYSAAAAQLKIDPNYESLNADQHAWVEQLIFQPDRDPIRQQLLEFLREDAQSDTPQLTKDSHDLIGALADVETPGTERKAGPSLRHVAEKVGPTFLYDWLRDPTHFRPSTRMPRFFGQWDHLDDTERSVSERYEPIEILGIVTYLTNNSQPGERLEPGDGAFSNDTAEQIARGKLLFETRGCLACHQHQDFPHARATQGPELTNLGDKFALDDTPDARSWLYSWLKNPMLYHPRTKMPNLYLEPITSADGTMTDPAADIALYLLESSNQWKPLEDTADRLTPNQANLDALVLEHLKSRMYAQDAEEAMQSGQMPSALAASLGGAEGMLAGEMTEEKKLLYIGQRTISKYGCYACHDIPGFEKAKPIGTALADWGRKDPSKLAFEHIAEYLTHGHGHGPGNGNGNSHGASETNQDHHRSSPAEVASPMAMATASPQDAGIATEIDERFYRDRLMEHDRTGFIWQKLKEPRSYDYGKARNKDSFNDRLRMPHFPLNDVEREAVVTFVLGLVAEPPAYEFVYHPDERKAALIAGHQALQKFNCVGCHIVNAEKWTLEIPKGYFEPQPSNPSQTFPFMPHQFTTDEIVASEKPDPLRGTVSVTLHGMPEISSESGTPRILDEEGDPIEEDLTYDPATLIYPFEIWQPALIDGNPYQVGVTPLEIEATWIKQRSATFGGDLTHWLLPRAVELEKQANPQADGKQAYGWLPPPLVNEGEKVQTEWLYGFLLEPFPIRPAVLMRMPKFNLAPHEATALVNYFAAKENVDYPYEFSAAMQNDRLDAEDASYEAALQEVPKDERPAGETRFDHVMNIVTSNDYCVQCHMVADFVPKTSARAMAPDLSVVNTRLRPNYLKRWLANPKQLLPYTPMPVNVKYDADAPQLGGVAQSLYHGSSLEQLDGLVELLMNYPRYAKSRAEVSSLVKTGPAAGATDTEGSDTEGSDTGGVSAEAGN